MKHLKNFLKGIPVGIATLIPGASGGTMAIIMGVYDNLVHCVSSLFKDFKKNFLFLFEVGLGTIVGILLLSRFMEAALSNYRSVMQFLFMGLITGGLPMLYKKSTSDNKKDYKNLIFLAIGLIIVLLLSKDYNSVPDTTETLGFSNMIHLLIAGVIIAIALVLPGISASLVLYTLGLYDVTMTAINNFNIPYLVPIGIGGIIGTFATARILEKLFQKYPNKTYMAIMGFVIGSLVPLFPGIPQGVELLASALAFILGFLIIFWLGKKGFTD